MTITGTIREAETKNAIPFAVAFVSDSSGAPTSNAATADANGKFTLNANNGDTITAQIVGRTPVSKNVDAYGVSGSTWDLPMADAANLAEATIIGQAVKNHNWKKIGIAALIAALAIVIIKKYVIKN